jgi:SAM-dependent methyltransferase
MDSILIEIIRNNRSLSRIASDLTIKRLRIKGRVLDIGSGRDIYYRKFENFSNLEIVSLNIVNKKRPNVIGTAEGFLPFKNESFDVCVAFRVLEHIYNTKKVIKEVKRVLKKDGKFYAYVPFLYPFHADPQDFHRFTDMALKKMFEEEGFVVKVIPVGWGPFSVAFLMINVIFPNNIFFRLINLLIATISITLDLILNLKSKESKRRFAFGYLVEAQMV